MSTIKATLQASTDGTLHLPLPPELRHGKLKVTATIEPEEPMNGAPKSEHLNGFGCLKGKIWIAPDFDEPIDDFKEYSLVAHRI